MADIVARLIAEIDEIEMNVRAVIAERDSLRAENERLRAALASKPDLKIKPLTPEQAEFVEGVIERHAATFPPHGIPPLSGGEGGSPVLYAAGLNAPIEDKS